MKYIIIAFFLKLGYRNKSKNVYVRSTDVFTCIKYIKAILSELYYGTVIEYLPDIKG